MAAKQAASKKRDAQRAAAKSGNKSKRAGEQEARALVLQIRAKETVDKNNAKLKVQKATKARAKAEVDERMNKLKVDASSLKSLNKNVQTKAKRINMQLAKEKAAQVAAKAADDKTKAAKAAARKKVRDTLSSKIAKQEQSKEESSQEYFTEVKSIQKQRKMQYDHVVDQAKKIGLRIKKHESTILAIKGKLKGEPNEHTQQVYTKDLQAEVVKLAQAKDRFDLAREQIVAIKNEQRSAQRSLDKIAKDCIGSGCNAFETSANAKETIAAAQGKALALAKAALAEQTKEAMENAVVIKSSEKIVGEPFQ